MGKTAAGAVWLDPERTSPYDFYQYWINTEDPDVERFLAMFTFLPSEEVKRLGALRDAEIRLAKEILAFEATALAHGREEAEKARLASRALFGGEGGLDTAPSVEIESGRLSAGIAAYVLFADAGLAKSRSEAKRLIEAGGGYVNGEQVTAVDRKVGSADLRDGLIQLRAGKKKYCIVKAK